MPHRKVWTLWAGLACVGITAGCQAPGNDNAGVTTAFGLNAVPRQSEPPLDGDERSARHQPVDLEPAHDEANRKPGNLLGRLLSGREKDSPPSRALPVTSRTPATSDEEAEF
ncbi:MAG: hypothetical protein ACT4QC_16815 [Planctomycetaceae bacterium]